MEINIKDLINIQDEMVQTPKGIIRIYNEKGELIKECHNMVVKSGRKLLYELFKTYVLKNTKKQIDENDSTPVNISNATFKINFSYLKEAIKTVSDLSLSDIATISGNDGVINTVVPTVEYDDTDLKVIFKTSITGNTDFKKFNQIYLSYTADDEWDDNNVILFSRVAMDPVFLGANGTYSIYYSIYF